MIDQHEVCVAKVNAKTNYVVVIASLYRIAPKTKNAQILP
jgi:hypothetical protein